MEIIIIKINEKIISFVLFFEWNLISSKNHSPFKYEINFWLLDWFKIFITRLSQIFEIKIPV